MCCNPLRMGMISSRHDVLSRTSRTGGQSNRRWGSKAIRIGHSLEDSSLRTRKTALSAEILLGSPKTSRSISERNSRKIRLRCIFRRTLASIHPIYHKRCERDGLDFETMGLGEEDLELDDGTPAPIEQPTEIKTPPLSEKDQDDRVRMAFGLTHDDLLPEVNRKNQFAYYRYLLAHLTFPFRAKSWKKIRRDSDKLVRLTV